MEGNMSKYKLKQRRTFTEAMRREVVGLVENGKLSVATAMREYHVCNQTVYNWLYKYSTYNQKGAMLIVSKESQQETVRALQARIAELERTLGKKQMMIEFMESYLELADKELGKDTKKKFSWPPSPTTGPEKGGDGP
jgi:transposase-like protein